MNEPLNDKLELLNRKKLSMSAVETVDGFSEEQLNLTVAGVKVKISGDKIKITSFNKATGILTADGDFFDIRYMKKREPLVKKLLK